MCYAFVTKIVSRVSALLFKAFYSYFRSPCLCLLLLFLNGNVNDKLCFQRTFNECAQDFMALKYYFDLFISSIPRLFLNIFNKLHFNDYFLAQYIPILNLTTKSCMTCGKNRRPNCTRRKVLNKCQ